MPTSTWTKFYPFVEDVGKGVHVFGTHQLVVALVANANTPSQSYGTLSQLTQVSYAYCSSRNITTTSYTQASGTAKLILADLTLSASGGSVGPFRYACMYNDTPTSPADPLIGYYDYGADVTLATGESILLDFDNVNGIFSVT